MKKLSAILLVGAKALPISDSQPVDVCCYRPGTIYNGKWSTTESDTTCDLWENHDRIYADVESHNYCRNPHGDKPWCYTSDDKFERCNIPICTECTCDIHQFGECQWPKCDYDNFKSICKCDEDAVLHKGICMSKNTIDEPFNDECHPGDECGVGKCKYDEEYNLECFCDSETARLTKDEEREYQICEKKEKDPCTCGDDSWCRWDIDDRLVDCECPEDYFLQSLVCSKETTTTTTTTTSTTTAMTTRIEPSPAPLPPLRPSMPGECWYEGKRNWTKSGKWCLRWDDDSKRYTEKIIKNLFSEVFDNEPMDHNYCRNPTGDESGPWCYVKNDDDRYVEWEECNVDQVEYCADPSAYVERDNVKPETTTTIAPTPTPEASKCGEDELEIVGECKAKPVCDPKYEHTCVYGCFDHFDWMGKPDSCKCMENTEPAADNKLVCVVSEPRSSSTTTSTTSTTTAAVEDNRPVYLLTGAPEPTFNGEYIYDEESNKLEKKKADIPNSIHYDELSKQWSISLMSPLPGFYVADGSNRIEQLETLSWKDLEGDSKSEMRLRRKGENCDGENACGYGSCKESGCDCDTDAEYEAEFKACVRRLPKQSLYEKPLWDAIVVKEPTSTRKTTTTTTTTTTMTTTTTTYQSQKNQNYHFACSKDCGEHGKCVIQFGAEVCECDVGYNSWGATPCF